MKKYKGIVFDFDMTLADSSRIIVELLNQTVTDFGYVKKTYEEILPIVGNTHEIMLSFASGEKNPERIFEMREHYRKISRVEMPKRTMLFDGAAECLKAAYNKNLKIGLLSLKLVELSTATLKKFDVLKYFSVVLGCEDIPKPKPDPSGLLLAIEKFNLPKDDVLYVGDSLVDEETAKGADVDFAAMLLGGTKKEQFDTIFVKQFYHSLAELRNEIEKM